MTTKLIITSIAILTSMTVGIVALTQVYKSNTKVAMVSSSSSVLSSRSSVASSSSAVQSSSVVVGVESVALKPTPAVETPPKVAESKKPEAVKPVVVASVVNIVLKNDECKIPADMIKYKSELGCFTIFTNRYFTYADDNQGENAIGSPENPMYSKELENYYQDKLGLDFFNKVRALSKSSHINIGIRGSSKISDGVFNIHLGFLDVEYLKSVNISGTDADTYMANYIVNLNEPKTFKLESFTDRTK